MASLWYMRYHKNELENNLNDINNILASLQNSINELQVVKQNIKAGYTLNEVSADNNYIDTIIEKEQAIYNDLVNVVIPTTKNKISYLRQKIREKENES